MHQHEIARKLHDMNLRLGTEAASVAAGLLESGWSTLREGAHWLWTPPRIGDGVTMAGAHAKALEWRREAREGGGGAMKPDHDWQDPEDWGVIGWTLGVFACLALVVVLYVGSILLGVWAIRLMGVQP